MLTKRITSNKNYILLLATLVIGVLSFLSVQSMAFAEKSKTKTHAITKNFQVVNSFILALDTLGDSCLEDKQVLSDNQEAARVIDLAFWLWPREGVDRSEMAMNLECFSRSNEAVYKKLFSELGGARQQEIKDAIEKARRLVKEGNG